MLFSTLGAVLLSSLIGVARAQDVQVPALSNQTSTPLISNSADSFINAGGNVLNDKVNVYIVFYGNWSSSNSQAEQTIFMNFIDGVSSTGWFSTLKEYTGSDGNGVTGPLNVAAAVVDSGSHGLILNDTATHQQIILDAVNSGYLSATNEVDAHGIYVIMSGPDVQDSSFCHSHCGYNSYTDQFQYMYIGYPGSCPNSCIPPISNTTSPNNNPSIDAAVTIFSHEIQDVLTDPRNNAWIMQVDGKTIELGDFCAGSGVSQEQWFGTLQKNSNGASYNLQVSDKQYLVQTIFSKSKKQCLLSSD
ncbi:phosphate-induced protein 1 [Dichotomocladium elegans]|nr:phosphate-induced protein 1 [Dichotomocladium elegans]